MGLEPELDRVKTKQKGPVSSRNRCLPRVLGELRFWPFLTVSQRTLPYKKYYGVVTWYHRSNSLFAVISCEYPPPPGKQGVSETLS